MITPCLTVIIPCFNEENTILELVESVIQQTCVKQIIVIDDGSTDNSLINIQTIHDSRLLIIKNGQNIGKGASIRRAIQYATAEFLVFQDADLEYSPREYLKLLQPLIEGYADAVYGSRFLSHEYRRALYFWHSMGNKFLTLLSNAFSNLYLTDMETCYKMMKTSFAKQLKIQEDKFGIEPEITAKLAKMGARIFEVGISYRGRTYKEGKKITWKDGFVAIKCIFKYNLTQSKL